RIGSDSGQIAKNRIPRTMSVWALTPEARMELPAFMRPRTSTGEQQRYGDDGPRMVVPSGPRCKGGDGLGPTTVVPSGPRSKGGDGFCAPGAGSGLAETQQAIRSTSLMVSGQADCEATGAGAGLAHAASKSKGIRSTE